LWNIAIRAAWSVLKTTILSAIECHNFCLYLQTWSIWQCQLH